MKILVIQNKKIGDVLLSTILCANLKKAIPNAEIHYLISEEALPLLKGNPHIDKPVVIKSEHRTTKKAYLNFALQLKHEQYDVIIDAYSKIESWVIVFLSKAKIRISFKKKYRTFLYTHNLSREELTDSTPGKMIDIRLLLISPFIKDIIPEREPRLYLQADEIQETKNWLKNYQKECSQLIMIPILGSTPNKTYPINYMLDLIHRLAHHTNAVLIFNYSHHQKEIAKNIYDSCSNQIKHQIIYDIPNYSLRTFILIMNECTAIIGNEGGSIHIAKALNKPSFTIFSPMVSKLEWSTFEDDCMHVAVHPDDYFKPQKEINSYQQLTPCLIWPKLALFIENNLHHDSEPIVKL